MRWPTPSIPAVVLFSTAMGVALIGVPGKRTLLDSLRTVEQAVVLPG